MCVASHAPGPCRLQMLQPSEHKTTSAVKVKTSNAKVRVPAVSVDSSGQAAFTVVTPAPLDPRQVLFAQGVAVVTVHCSSYGEIKLEMVADDGQTVGQAVAITILPSEELRPAKTYRLTSDPMRVSCRQRLTPVHRCSDRRSCVWCGSQACKGTPPGEKHFFNGAPMVRWMLKTGKSSRTKAST